MKKSWTKREIAIEVEGKKEHDLDLAFDEAVRVIKKTGCVTGFDSNDTGGYSFTVKKDVQSLTKIPSRKDKQQAPNDSSKWLLCPAEGDIDADEGLTKLDVLQMLATELGYGLTKAA